MSGMGTSIDRRGGRTYIFLPLDHSQAEAGYRTSWLIRKIVDVPAKDMTRAWRDWQATKEQIEAIEKEEKRLQLREKVKRALILSRLYGGGALILGTEDSDPMIPLDTERVKKDGLTYVHAMAPQQLGMGQLIMDPADPWFGKPAYFEISASNTQRVKLHPSRVVDIVGQRAPEGAVLQSLGGFWGDPIMQAVGDAVGNADTAQAGFAALIEEAKLDIIKIPDLLDHWGTDEHEAKLLRRLEVAAAGKSTWRALLLDAGEEWEQRQMVWAGIPQVLTTFLEIVAGAADIPVTRLLGQSPKGLQSTGEGEAKDYHDKVKADQEEILAPALDRIDELLIRSALGSRPPEVHYVFADLVEPDEAAEGLIEKQRAETLKIYADTGMLHEEAITDIAKNSMIESGRWPGCEEAFESAGEIDREADVDPDDPKALAAVSTRAENVLEFRKKGAVTDSQATLLMADARPRSLYVQRKLINSREFLTWAKAQGFESTTPADELHVTILYSRRAVDWMKAEAAWNQDEDGQMTVPPGGVRIVEALGDKGAIVLLFGASQLSWRHEELMRSTGASHDFDGYQPHVTITYDGPAGLDLADVEPYRGKLVFGPEIFEELDPDYVPGR